MCRRKEEGGLGFRDLHLFNLAMLARQAWRLLMTPDSLCGQVLKAKYYRNCGLLDAKEAPGISYTWRSILRGIKALKDGLIWCVGDGNSIKIWLNPWIPRGVTRMPITPRGHTLITHISDLIDQNTGDWDQVLVRDIFWGGRCATYNCHTGTDG
jgi:hypothetical protein